MGWLGCFGTAAVDLYKSAHRAGRRGDTTRMFNSMLRPPMTLQSLMLRNVLGHAFGFRAYGLALGLRVEGVRLGFPTTPKAWKPVQEVQVGQSHIPEIKKYSLNHSFYIFKGRYLPELRDI